MSVILQPLIGPVVDKLNLISARIGMADEVYDQIGSTIGDRIRDTFRAGRDPYGAMWAPLAESTLLKRGRARTGGKSLRTKRGNTRSAALSAILTAKPLLDTGRLRNSISHQAGPDEVVISATSVEYASTHQFGARKGQFGTTSRGAPIPWGDIPARAFFPIVNKAVVLPPDWEADVLDIIERHLEKTLAN